MTSRLAPAAATAAVLCATAIPGTANAAAPFGETFPPSTGCDAPRIQLQTTSPGSSYAAPASGVITSWSFMAAADTQPRLKLKVARAVGGNDFMIVGESAVETPAPGVLNRFATRISVLAGDVIGFYNTTLGRCGEFAPPGYATHAGVMNADPAPGTTTTLGPGMFHLDIAALLEPDADSDGFGDETQDLCLGQAGEIDGCPVLETTITKGPKDRTKKKRATFEFSSNITAASFECSLDGGTFASCSSGQTFKVKRGKHSFAVRASAKGQTDASPATDDWKVKKKRKRKR